MQQLENDIKELIISSLALEDITPDDIDPSAPLFVNGLGLDSIDALELGLALQKRYGVSLSAESEEVRAHFTSVKTLAAFVVGRRRFEDARHGGPRLITGSLVGWSLEDFDLHDGGRALSMHRAETVGARVAAAENDDVSTLRVNW